MLSLEFLRPRLARYLGAKLGLGDEPAINELERISIGHSRAMFLAGISWTDNGASHERRFAIRVEQGGVFGTSSLAEVRIMRGLAAAGVPIARVLWYEPAPSVIGFPFFVMDWVEGSSGPSDAATLAEFIATLERLHTLQWRAKDVRFPRVPVAPRDGALMEIDRWYSVYRSARFRPVPLLEEAAAWLRLRAPESSRIGIVHGDPGPGNFIHANGKVAALTDWEFCHLGDPVEDWSFMATMRGAAIMPLGEWADLIHRVTGTSVSDEQWRYWEVFNQFKGACANITALKVFVSGENPAPNMAAIGTALHLRMVQRLSDIIGEAG
jgi:aminoglycoside phosphotransferase (APT) family kinase protein